MNKKSFLKRIAKERLKNIDKAVGLLWLSSISSGSEMTAKEICKEFELAGYGTQNSTVLRRSLEKDRRVVKSKDFFRIREKFRDKVDEQFSVYLTQTPIKESDAVLPLILFSHSKNYIVNVVKQLNSSYEHSLFDCCAVMCRRLLETLIIEMYESMGEIDKIRDIDGNFYMFSGLLICINKDQTLTLSRNAKKALADFKSLGDLSAHNRKFNAKKNDIDRIRDGLRLVCEELINTT